MATRRLVLLVLSLLVLTGLTHAHAVAPDAGRKPKPSPSPPPAVPAIHRGVNLSQWFQANSADAIDACTYGAHDFAQLKELGVDTVRLPINLTLLSSGAPDYTIDPRVLAGLDQAVAWADDHDLTLILDNHTETWVPDRADQDVLVRLWTQLATRYRGSTATLVYEVLNEPNHGSDADDGITDDAQGVATWSQRQGEVVKAIRAIDPSTPILVGGVDWNGLGGEPWRSTPVGLAALPTYDAANIVYGFHFYEPMLFTHQGAAWSLAKPGLSLEGIRDVPFPYDAARMPSLPPEYAGTWIENAWRAYPSEGSATHLRARLQQARDFAAARNVPVIVGEFGALQDVAPAPDRVRYYETVRRELEAAGLPWIQWDYHHGFGLFEKGSRGHVDQHLDPAVLQALGYPAPAAGRPRTLFGECRGWKVDDVSAAADHSFADPGAHTGRRAIRLSRPARWNHVGLGFVGGDDLSAKVAEGYALSFWVRSTRAGSRLQYRFEDTDAGSADVGWRRGGDVVLTQADTWQHVLVPLDGLTALGGWDPETGWHDGAQEQGRFDWSRVDAFKLVAEHEAWPDAEFRLDDVRLVRP